MHNHGLQLQYTYTDLPGQFYTRLAPVPVSAPAIVLFNDALADALGLDFSTISDQERAALFAGNWLPEGARPFAQAYAGHQFGHFTMLGDGRAHMWGEHVTPDGQRLDIQFKGSGRTRYSRGGDGRAVLGPMLREYIVAEAMHALGIATTRALAVAITGEEVFRETVLPGAILTRVAASHIRVGTFQFAAAHEEKGLVKSLLDYTIARHDPTIGNATNRALAFLKNVMERQVDLIVDWMRVGFVHGVMNTDNMAISGETIDYGPCAFMDAYHGKTVFSSIDRAGRYAYANQPAIGQWNIARLAETLLPLIDENPEKAIQKAEDTVNRFSRLYQTRWQAMMRAKLGLFGEQAEDAQLVSDLLDWMEKNRADYTNTFYDLGQKEKPAGAIYTSQTFHNWYENWQRRLQQNAKPITASLRLMRNTNPAVIPRNHKVEEALNAATSGDLKPCHDLLAVLRRPYNYCDAPKAYQSPPATGEQVYQTFCGT